jgi:hypothetical protein
VVARIVAEHMSRTLGQRLVIENIAGAGGTTATTRVMRATSDGYTIGVGHMGTHATASAFYPNLAYRPDADFAPIGIVGQNAFLISTTKNFPANDLREFIAYAKANHQKLNIGHAGVGSTTHLTGLLLNKILGLDSTMVPFNSGAAAMNAMVAGHVDYMSAPIPDVVPQFKGGTIKGPNGTCFEANGIIPACSSDGNNWQPRVGFTWEIRKGTLFKASAAENTMLAFNNVVLDSLNFDGVNLRTNTIAVPNCTLPANATNPLCVAFNTKVFPPATALPTAACPPRYNDEPDSVSP